MNELRILLLSLMLLLISGSASAEASMLVNGDFESGDLMGWNTSKVIRGPGIDRGSHPQIVASPIYSGSYSAYFYSADQQGYSWWPASGRIDQARQTIANVNYGMLNNMVFDVWSKYRGRYTGYYHHVSGGTIDFRILDSSNNIISRHIIRHFPSGHNMYQLQEGPAPASFTIYNDGFDGTAGPWRNTVLDIADVIDDPIAGINESEKALVDHIEIVVYAYSFGTADYDAELWVDEMTVYMKPITATVDIRPDILNLNGRSMMRHGRGVTAYIELPEGYDVADINVSTVLLNDTIPAKLHPSRIGDYDMDGVPDLMVTFDRSAVKELFSGQQCGAELAVTGSLDGMLFEGSDTIDVIERGRHMGGGKCDIDDVPGGTTVYLTEGFEDGDWTNNPTWTWNTDTYSSVQSDTKKNGDYALMTSLPDSYSNKGNCPNAPECVTASTPTSVSGDSYYNYSTWIMLNYRSEMDWKYVLRQGSTMVMGVGMSGYGTSGDGWRCFNSTTSTGSNIGTSGRSNHWYFAVIEYNPVQNKANCYIYNSDGRTLLYSATDFTTSGTVDNLALMSLNRMSYGGTRNFYWDDIGLYK